MVSLDLAMVEQIEELLRLQAAESTSGESPTAVGNGTSMLRRPKVESRLTPREVQSLLRTGRSVGEIAEVAGMTEDWVGRFAPPVLAEQARVVERARVLIYSKPRIGPSMQTLGDSVIWNLAERGTILTGEAEEDAWSAFQQPDGGWVVRVSYLAERRRQHADWTVDMTHGMLKAINRLGNELGYVEPGRRRPQALPPATPASAAAQRAAAAPPKLTPPPPLPARPAGRLSLLGNAGATRPVASGSGPSGRVSVPDYRRAESARAAGWSSDLAPAPSRAPRQPFVASPPPSEPEEPMVEAGAPSPSPSPAATGAPQQPLLTSSEPMENDRSTRPAPARTPDAPPRQPAEGADRDPAASLPTTPRARRPRPLRPRSAVAAPAVAPRKSSKVADEAPMPRADGAEGAARRGAVDEAAGGRPTPPTPRPRRERPLQAPSRIRRQELAQAPQSVTRRPLVAPGVAGDAEGNEGEATARPSGQRSTEPPSQAAPTRGFGSRRSGEPVGRISEPAPSRRVGSSRSGEPVGRPAEPAPSRRLGSPRPGEPVDRSVDPAPSRRLGSARSDELVERPAPPPLPRRARSPGGTAEPGTTAARRRLPRPATEPAATGSSRRLGAAEASESPEWAERPTERGEHSRNPGSPTPSQPVGQRFGPPHGEEQRKASTAERFGVGRPAPVPDAAPSEPANSHIPPARPGRLRANRPLRAPAAQPTADAFERDAFEGDEGDADGPITAPVPTVAVLDEDSFERYPAPSDRSDGRDQVLIRTGQAGASEPRGRRPAPGGTPPPDERSSRSGLLKLRRRLQGSS